MKHIKEKGHSLSLVAAFLDGSTKEKSEVITLINGRPVERPMYFLSEMQWVLRNPNCNSVGFRFNNGPLITFYEEDAALLETPVLSEAEMAYIDGLKQIMSSQGRDIAEDSIEGYPQWLYQLFIKHNRLRPGLSWRNIYRIEASLDSMGILFRDGNEVCFNMKQYEKLSWYTLNVYPFLLYSDRSVRDAEAKYWACQALRLYSSRLKQL